MSIDDEVRLVLKYISGLEMSLPYRYAGITATADEVIVLKRVSEAGRRLGVVVERGLLFHVLDTVDLELVVQ